MFIKANIANLLGLIVFLSTFFLSDSKPLNVFLILIAGISIYLYLITFEYQRMTLMIGRYISFKNEIENKTYITHIQMLLSPSMKMVALIFIDSIITGFTLAIFLKFNVFLFLVYLIVKYVLIAILPIPLPYAYLFSELKNAIGDLSKIFTQTPENVSILMQSLEVYKKMPHNKNYENWIYNHMQK